MIFAKMKLVKLNWTILACACGFGLSLPCRGETPAEVSANVADAPAKPSEILPGRPDAHVVVDDALGPEFSSLAAGIAFRPPAGGKEMRPAISGDDIVQFANEKQNWTLKASRLVLSKSAPLVNDTERDATGILREGLLETMAKQIKADTGGAEILRQDPINVVQTPVGMIAARYSRGPDTWLTQRAIIQGGDDEMLYYILDFTTPVLPKGSLENDPQAKKAVDLFSQVVESTHLLDQTQLIEDEKERLFYTRALYVNMTEPQMRPSLCRSAGCG